MANGSGNISLNVELSLGTDTQLFVNGAESNAGYKVIVKQVEIITVTTSYNREVSKPEEIEKWSNGHSYRRGNLTTVSFRVGIAVMTRQYVATVKASGVIPSQIVVSHPQSVAS